MLRFVAPAVILVACVSGGDDEAFWVSDPFRHPFFKEGHAFVTKAHKDGEWYRTSLWIVEVDEKGVPHDKLRVRSVGDFAQVVEDIPDATVANEYLLRLHRYKLKGLPAGDRLYKSDKQRSGGGFYNDDDVNRWSLKGIEQRNGSFVVEWPFYRVFRDDGECDDGEWQYEVRLVTETVGRSGAYSYEEGRVLESGTDVKRFRPPKRD